MDFVISLLVSTHWKDESYDFILVIIDCLTKMVYYKPIKVTINALSLTKVIMNVVVRQHNISKSIVTN